MSLRETYEKSFRQQEENARQKARREEELRAYFRGQIRHDLLIDPLPDTITEYQLEHEVPERKREGFLPELRRLLRESVDLVRGELWSCVKVDGGLDGNTVAVAHGSSLWTGGTLERCFSGVRTSYGLEYIQVRCPDGGTRMLEMDRYSWSGERHTGLLAGAGPRRERTELKETVRRHQDALRAVMAQAQRYVVLSYEPSRGWDSDTTGHLVLFEDGSLYRPSWVQFSPLPDLFYQDPERFLAEALLRVNTGAR